MTRAREPKQLFIEITMALESWGEISGRGTGERYQGIGVMEGRHLDTSKKHQGPSVKHLGSNWTHPNKHQEPFGGHVGPSGDHLESIWEASGGHAGPSGPREGTILNIIENHCVFHGWRPWVTIWPQSGEGDMDEVP